MCIWKREILFHCNLCLQISHCLCFYNVLYKWLGYRQPVHSVLPKNFACVNQLICVWIYWYNKHAHIILCRISKWMSDCTTLRSTGFYTTRQLNLNYRESVLDKHKNTQKHSNLDQREMRYLTPVWSFPGRKLLKGNTITRNFSKVKYVRRRTDTWEKIITMKNRNSKSEHLEHKCFQYCKVIFIKFFP